MRDNKIDIAVKQLRSSIQLYNKRDFISSITLAGAAEEILGKIASEITKRNALTDEKEFLDQIAELYNKPKPDLKKIIKHRNKVKNYLKHYDLYTDQTLEKTDYKSAAEDLIIGAINNYKIIFNKEPIDRVIKNFWDRISL